jgi:multisubunit Na+/H+ antiporter MnhG subunit
MSSLVFDLLIWTCLFVGIGFSILAFAGLLIFPDIRSRMYTATRASLISAGAISIAAILFGISGFLGNGGSQYGTLVIHAIFLLGILVIANICITRQILQRTGLPDACGNVTGDNKNN